MKIKFLFLFTILIQVACQSQKNDLEKSWILVKEGTYLTAEENPVFEAALCHFENGQYIVSSPLMKKSKTGIYHVKDNYIHSDSNYFGNIIHLSKDSLIFETDSLTGYNLYFEPLTDTHFSKSDKQKIQNLLLSNAWEVFDNDLQINHKYYCYDLIWRFDEDNEKRKFIVSELELEDEKHISDASEWWILKEFQGKLIFCYSVGTFDRAYFEITSYSDDEIKGSFMNAKSNRWQSATMKKVKNVSSSILNKQKEMILGDWYTETIISPSISELIAFKDSSEYYANGFGKSRYENKILVSDVTQQNLRFSFQENGDFSIWAGEKLIRKGEDWGILKDGTYIYLNSEILGEGNYLELINIEQNKLEFRYTIHLWLPTKSNIDFVTVPLHLILHQE